MTKKQEYMRRWKKANPDKVKANYERWVMSHPGRRKDINVAMQLRRYGLSRAGYDLLLQEQNGTCAICGRPETTKRKGVLRSLCVDHNHRTKLVRGLLCCSCNRAVGYLGDDPARAHSLATYLEDRDG